MIDRREILETASRMTLQPHVIEKDYVLGWMLAGINAHPALRDSWIFKGGTCLKKCFFETYRFSEDLDFTLTNPAHIDDEFLTQTFNEIGEWIYEQTGIEIPGKLQSFDIYTNPRGTVSCQGKISYRGPVSPPTLPRIKLDLTADERIVLAPRDVPVFHPYTDVPAEGINILAYAYEELFGEKVRALAERTRPRDLYDVINLFRNADARPVASVMLDVLQQKCEFKGIAIPTLIDLEPHRNELQSLWQNMLAHQLPTLPPYESFWNELPAFFDWLQSGIEPTIPTAYAIAEGETVLRQRDLRLPVSGQAQSFIEIIRFAAGNLLQVELDYQGSTRRIEPYSLRQTKDGNIVLHAFNVDKDEHRSYRVDRIQGARVTNVTFVPQYEVELRPQGAVQVRQAATRARSATSYTPFIRTKSVTVRPKSTRRMTGMGKPIYIYQCPLCQKKFRRERYDSHLNPHKNEWGGQCSGKTGYLVDTRY
ncbi:MAG: nucleotidyl transferase AbiEii/AbiGii toxin family protein [Methylobacillus sp.]|jgi:predicted nucleotidyltransferase component of viral defense system|nr:nucleotidyl transferase AbiEii/AbiGii toxin family protein [Methylobacillus sp.]